MQDLFSISARPRFADKCEILAIAREAACRIVRAHPEARKIILFGSFARGDYGARSDLDLLIVLEHSSRPLHERITEFQPYVSAYPTDMLVLTEAELRSRVADGDPFLQRALNEGIVLYPESDEACAHS